MRTKGMLMLIAVLTVLLCLTAVETVSAGSPGWSNRSGGFGISGGVSGRSVAPYDVYQRGNYCDNPNRCLRWRRAGSYVGCDGWSGSQSENAYWLDFDVWRQRSSRNSTGALVMGGGRGRGGRATGWRR